MMSEHVASIGKVVRAEVILRSHGMQGDALLKLAYQAANVWTRKHQTFPASRIDDLAQHCAMQVCRRVHRYDPAENPNFDPAKNPASTPFRSWCWYQMELACQDFTRQRKEGFAGRLGRDKEIAVTHLEHPEVLIDPGTVEGEFELNATAERLRLWRRAAAHSGWSLADWLAITADHAARELLRDAA